MQFLKRDKLKKIILMVLFVSIFLSAFSMTQYYNRRHTKYVVESQRIQSTIDDVITTRERERLERTPQEKIQSIDKLIGLINAYRISTGLLVLAQAQDMNIKAKSEAFYIASENCTYKALHHSDWPGEIIGCEHGYADPDSEVVKDWIASPPHHAIMIGRFTTVGCSRVDLNKISWYSCNFK